VEWLIVLIVLAVGAMIATTVVRRPRRSEARGARVDEHRPH
jgi:hypothetical protein